MQSLYLLFVLLILATTGTPKGREQRSVHYAKKTIVFQLKPNPYLDTLPDKYTILVTGNLKGENGDTLSIAEETIEYNKLSSNNTVTIAANDTIWVYMQLTHDINVREPVSGWLLHLRTIQRQAQIVLPPSTEDTLYVTSQFPEDCQYDATCFNRMCPKCKKEDEVKHLVHGLEGPSPTEEVDEVYRRECYNDGFCDIDKNCIANWFCVRDSLAF